MMARMYVFAVAVVTWVLIAIGTFAGVIALSLASEGRPPWTTILVSTCAIVGSLTLLRRAAEDEEDGP
jgi:predicted secreted protein